ncbi:transmembrane protein, putative, partial [Rhizoctonia solani AG-3 Rhs1AP]
MNSSHAGYAPLPAYDTEPASPVYPPEYEDQRGRLGESYREAVAALEADPRFHRDEPKAWQRVMLLVVMAMLFYLAYRMKAGSFLGMEES